MSTGADGAATKQFNIQPKKKKKKKWRKNNACDCVNSKTIIPISLSVAFSIFSLSQRLHNIFKVVLYHVSSQLKFIKCEKFVYVLLAAAILNETLLSSVRSSVAQTTELTVAVERAAHLSVVRSIIDEEFFGDCEPHLSQRIIDEAKPQ